MSIIEKGHYVLKFRDRYRKVWLSEPDFKSNTLEGHIEILDKLMPGYVLDYKVNTDKHINFHTYIDYRIVPGTPAVEFEPTKEFIKKIRDFCLMSLQQYKPFAHWDWSLGNILINGKMQLNNNNYDNMQLVDWDDVDIFSVDEVFQQMNHIFRDDSRFDILDDIFISRATIAKYMGNL